MDTARIAAADLTTLQIAVPAADPLLGHLRDRLGDDATVLSPGHVSFGYPWLPPPEAAVAVDAVAAALREVQPPWVTLVGPRWFPPDHRGRTTAHLVPEPVDAVLHLAGVVADTSDHHPVDLRPHCSLVRVPAGRDRPRSRPSPNRGCRSRRRWRTSSCASATADGGAWLAGSRSAPMGEPLPEGRRRKLQSE